MKKILLLIISFNFIFAYIGTISALKGEAKILRNSNSLNAKLGMKIEKKDIINTKNGNLQIIFKDRTIITIGKNSQFKIENYLFDDNNQNANFKLSKGIIKTITGKISKVAPKRFHIKTKNALIGIRGTIFIVEVKNNITTLTMIEGITSFEDLYTKKVYIIKQGEQIILNPSNPKRIIIKKTKKIPEIFSTQNYNKLTNNLLQEMKQTEIKSVTKIENDYSKLGYITYDETPTKVWYAMKYDVTPEDEVQHLIDTHATANYSGDIIALTNEGIATGSTSLNFDFGYETWNGEFEFKTNAGTNWHFYADGDLDTKGFSGSVNDTDSDSDAKNISGDISGKFYGSNAIAVGGNANLSSDNKGDSKISFSAKQ